MIRRTTDILIRYGGDEASSGNAGSEGRRFHTEASADPERSPLQKEVPGFSRLQLSVSIGGVLSEEHKIENAVEMADKLMYRAKNHKNAVVTAVDEDSDGRPERSLSGGQ